VERLRPAAAGEKTVVRGAGRAGELRRVGGAVRRWVVAATAAVLLLCVVVFGVQSQGSPAQAASTCKGIQRTVNYVDRSRQLLAYFQVNQSWCWNGRAVTYVSQAKTVGKVTKLGASRGWRYDGLIDKRDYYFVNNGLSRGGHASIREGSFTVCAEGYQCYQRTPKVQLYVYHNGQAYSLGRM
jgi:hypothetical protein